MKNIDDKLVLMMISGIAKRAAKVITGLGYKADVMNICMDLEYCHANGCPLDLPAMATGEESDVLHDVAGIGRHLDHTTGKLTDCFVPRFALSL